MYGMELIIPKTTPLEQLERYQKKLLKQLLSLPPNTPDPAVYLLSGTLPVEAQLHIRALNFFNNICDQEQKSIEKILARQQLRTKTINLSIDIKKMLIKYNLQDLEYYLDNPMTKRLWITSIKREIQNYWQELITSMGSGHYSDSPLFRQPIAPTAHYSDSPLLRQPISPTTHYSVKNGQKWYNYLKTCCFSSIPNGRLTLIFILIGRLFLY
jgi:hypothetical protein